MTPCVQQSAPRRHTILCSSYLLLCTWQYFAWCRVIMRQSSRVIPCIAIVRSIHLSKCFQNFCSSSTYEPIGSFTKGNGMNCFNLKSLVFLGRTTSITLTPSNNDCIGINFTTWKPSELCLGQKLCNKFVVWQFFLGKTGQSTFLAWFNFCVEL